MDLQADEVASTAVEVSTDETAMDSGDTSYTLPDGKECKGHDEDFDGVPDNCDNCPNVFNPGRASLNFSPHVDWCCGPNPTTGGSSSVSGRCTGCRSGRTTRMT
mgnify:CR=1 FL=1